MSEPSRRFADVPAAWERAGAGLRTQVGDVNYRAWIAPLRCRGAEGGEIVLEAPDRTVLDGVARHFLRLIEERLAAELGATWPVRLGLPAVRPELPIRLRRPSTTHTFETFVPGESNRLAYDAALDLCAGTGRSPLLVHGPSGVGKTHLLHAIFHALEMRGVLVACLPASQLVGGLLGAYQAHRHDTFWTQLGALHALLLDDVHSLAGQEAVQERLAEGLVDWIEGGRLLALTSDRPLEDVPGLAVPLAERFSRGVTVAIAPAEPALRLAILQLKARSLGLDLDGRLAVRIAVAIGGSIRRLEGVLTRLLAHARLQGRRIDEAFALEILPELRARATAAPLAVERIVEATATAFGTTARRVYGRARRRELLLARHVAMYLARKLLRQPLLQLAAAFDRDHSTVLYAWRAIETRLLADRQLADRVAEIERQLRDEER